MAKGLDKFDCSVFEHNPPRGLCSFFGIDISLATGLALASAAAAAAGTVATGVIAANQQSFQADVANRNADMQMRAADAEAEKAKMAGERRLALMTGMYRKAGIDPSVGSPVDVLAESAGDLELDVANLKYAGKIGALQSALSAQVAKQNARSSLTAGYIGAGTQLLTAGTRLYASAGSPVESGLSGNLNRMGSLNYGGPR